MKTCSLIALTIAICILLSLLLLREYHLRHRDIVNPDHYSPEFREVLKELQDFGDLAQDIDPRQSWSYNWWRMSSSGQRINVHIDQLHLVPVDAHGVEENRLRAYLPYAWEPPSTDCQIWANPPGLPGCDDGQSEYVMLLDRKSNLLYIYTYYNF